MGSYQLEVYKENSRTIQLTFKTAAGVAVNITGYTIRFTVKQRFDNSASDTTAIILKNVTSHTSPTTGETAISLSKSDLNISPGTYKYDMKYVDTSGNEVTMAQDDFIVKDVVTNR
jgi:hypothetical protein